MLAAIITICTLADASRGRDITVARVDGMTPMQCSAHAQAQFPDVMEAHPGWVITRWGCQRLELMAKGA